MSRTKTFDLEIVCELGDEYFLDWNKLSAAAKVFWNTTTKQPGCEGSGYISPINCDGCPFCNRYEVDES